MTQPGRARHNRTKVWWPLYDTRPTQPELTKPHFLNVSEGSDPVVSGVNQIP